MIPSAESLNPSTLPGLGLSEREHLPDTGGVYFLFESERIVYIGQASNLRRRWRAHEIRLALEDLDCCAIHWLELASESDRVTLEAALIRKFLPAYNALPAQPTSCSSLQEVERPTNGPWSVAEAAALLNVTTGRVRQLVSAGQIEFIWFHHVLMITANGLAQAKNRRTKVGRPPTRLRNRRTVS